MVRVIEDEEWKKLVHVRDTLLDEKEALTPGVRRELAGMLSMVVEKIEKLGDFTDRLR